jgi:hypothetical protein
MNPGAGGYMRWRIGLAFSHDEVDRPGAHGVNSLSRLRGYGGNHQLPTIPGGTGSNEQRTTSNDQQPITNN